MDADPRSLLDLYEASGDEDVYARAKPLYEQAIAATPDAELIRDYGYLLECHGRRTLRRAVEQYQRALTLDPDSDKIRYQKISARAALGEIDEEIRDYTTQLAAAPDDLRRYRYLALVYLAARRYDQARDVIDAGLALAGHDRVLIEARGRRPGRDRRHRRGIGGLGARARPRPRRHRPPVLHRLPPRTPGPTPGSHRCLASHPGLGPSPRLPPRRGMARTRTRTTPPRTPQRPNTPDP